MRKALILILFLVFHPCFLHAQEKKEDHHPKCKDEYSYAYFIYQEAMRNAKAGNCELSFKQFKESEKQWIYISTAAHCSKQEQEDATSNSSRISYDIGILKKKYCPNVGP